MNMETVFEALGSVRPITAGATSLVAAMAREIRLSDIIDESCEWDPGRSSLSPGKLVEGLVICMLSDRRALYRVEDFYEGKDVHALFGEGITAHHFNDDALGRALDKLFAAGGNRVLGKVISSALKVHGVKVDSVHFDLTSLSVYGEYEHQDSESALEIVFGYSKDRRPDLKQIQFGLGVNSEGIPSYGEVLSGNVSDKTWNRVTIERLRDMFPSEVLKELIYVADSSLVTSANLKEAAHHKIKLISRVPATFGIVDKLIEQAHTQGQWETAGSYSSSKDAAEYWTHEIIDAIDGVDYRFIVVRSSSMDSRKEKSINKRIERNREQIEGEARELFEREFVCEPDAAKQGELFMSKWKDGLHELSFETLSETIRERRSKLGRPKKDEEPPLERTVYRVKVKIQGIDAGRVAQARERESCFVLITNVMDANGYPARRILGEYKQQSAVETRFSFLKSPYMLGQVFLKKQSRVEALGYVVLMGLLLATLLERRVRKNLESEDEPLMIPGRRLTKRPTARMILDMLDTAQVAYIKHEGVICRVWCSTVKIFDVPRLLRLAGFGTEAYTNPDTGGIPVLDPDNL